jgi:hypothetical protein
MERLTGREERNKGENDFGEKCKLSVEKKNIGGGVGGVFIGRKCAAEMVGPMDWRVVVAVDGMTRVS